MAVSHIKQTYFESIATKYKLPSDVIQSIAYGENPALDRSLRFKILMEFVSEANEMFIAMIWKGEALPDTISNVPYYDYNGQVMEGLNLYLHRTAYTSQLLFLNSIIADDLYFEQLISKHPHVGFVVITAETVASLQNACQRHQRPYIFINHPTSTTIDGKYHITVDNKKMAQEIVAYLYGLGHRRIAHIQGISTHQVAIDRMEGYYQGLTSAGLTIDKDMVVRGNWREEGGYSATMQLLSLGTRPTAIIAANDRMAIGGMKAIKEAGLRVPEDISLVGFDDIAAAIQATPPLTTARLPMTQIGRKSAEYMIALLEGDTPQPQVVNLPLEFIIRESTGSPQGN